MRRLVVLGCLFLAVALVSAIALVARDGTTAGFTTDARVTLHVYGALVEQHLSSVTTGLAAVASTEEAASGDWDRIRAPLSEVAARAPTAAAVWFVRPDGTYYTVEEGLQDQSLSDRAYFPGLMAGREVHGDLVISKATGKRSAILAVPVRVDGRVVGAMGASIDLEKLSATVGSAMALPPDVIFYALDPEGRTTLHGNPSRIFEFPSDLGTPSLRAAVTRMLQSRDGTITYRFEGAERTVLFEHSDATGWVFVLGRIHG